LKAFRSGPIVFIEKGHVLPKAGGNTGIAGNRHSGMVSVQDLHAPVHPFEIGEIFGASVGDDKDLEIIERLGGCRSDRIARERPTAVDRNYDTYLWHLTF
jgi:hypothetical protein